jgi:hypothetical protein
MELSEHLVLVVDELIDAHDDTVRLSEELATDQRWEAHIRYLRELERVGREALAAATATADARAKSRRDRFRSSFPRRGDRRCARSGNGEGPT